MIKLGGKNDFCHNFGLLFERILLLYIEMINEDCKSTGGANDGLENESGKMAFI
jgi:hypothetical protein